MGQKAAIALEWADQIALRPNSEKSKSTGRPRGAVLEAAKHIGIDRQRVFEARVIRSSNQSLYQQLKAGKCSIHSALAEVRGTPEHPLGVSGSGRTTAFSGGLDKGDGTLGQVRRTGAKIVPSPQKPPPKGSSAFVNPTSSPPPTPATLDKALARIKAKLGSYFQAEVKARTLIKKPEEIIQFSRLPDAQMQEIGSLLKKGWTFPAASREVLERLTPANQIRALHSRTIQNGDSWCIAWSEISRTW